MYIVTFLHIFICALLIAIVLLQQGRGADAGVTFGGGGGTVFGAAGADTLLAKITTGLAICFMITSVILSASQNKWAATEGSLFKDIKEAKPVSSSNVGADPEARQETAPLAAPSASAPEASAAPSTNGAAPESSPASGAN